MPDGLLNNANAPLFYASEPVEQSSEIMLYWELSCCYRALISGESGTSSLDKIYDGLITFIYS